MSKKTVISLLTGIILTAGFIIGGSILFYLKGLPYIVSNPKVINYVENTAKKYLNADLIIEAPNLKTELSPKIDFSITKVLLTKENSKLLELDKFSTSVSFNKIFDKTIILNKLVARGIYVDINKIEKLIPTQKKKKDEKKSDWNIDIYNALLGVQNAEILYSLNQDTNIHLIGKHIGVNNAQKVKRNVYFQLNANIKRKNNSVNISLKDNKKVFFYNNKFHIENCPITINKSSIFINATADKKQNYDINLYSNYFKLNDILDFLNTQIIENNVHETLAYFSEIKGYLDFKLNIKNGLVNGNFKLRKLDFNVIPVNNLHITLNKGFIDLTPNIVTLKDFAGFYDYDINNKLDFHGTVKDYLKSIDTDLEGNARARGSFFRKHLTKLTGTNIDLKGDAPTRVTLKSKNNIMDIVWLFMLKPGENIKIGDDFLPFEDTLRVMATKMHLEKMILDITSMDYYMVDKAELEKGKPKPDAKRPDPIFRFSSSVDLNRNNHIKFIGFEIPNPLPSELFNVMINQNLFKRGKIGGKLTVDNSGKYPVLNGSLNMDRVLIPSQRTFIKEAVMDAKGDLIHLNARGGFKRAKFQFNGDILNEIKFPVIVKDINLSLENIDVYKLLYASTNEMPQNDNTITTDTGVVNVSEETNKFDIGNIIIEKCRLHLDKGNYKEILFSNLDADLTLDKNSILNVKSNKFDIAGGTSSLKVNSDLKNKKYNVWLGILKVDSEIIAKSLLNLEKEISGKASGLIELNTDETMKLSGNIKFIIKDGTIEKIGLVEYIMKFAALFRNPVVMISPGMFSDIVNIPEGNFEKITGTLELNKNIVRRIKIKTYSPDLSTYIAGRYNLENRDTSLRIYTKFSGAKKGFTGLLRNISLNALATRIPLSSRNDANYYAAELSELPEINADEKDCQVFLTKVEGDVERNNYLSTLKKIK